MPSPGSKYIFLTDYKRKLVNLPPSHDVLLHDKNGSSVFYFIFLSQTKEQQDQALNQSNKVFLYCAFLDYRWVSIHDLIQHVSIIQ